MPGISSLIRSAQAARNKQRTYEDQVASYEWSISQKTYGDYLEYNDYLNERMQSTGDQSKVLSYANTLKTSTRSYQSAEIQRASQRVAAGGGSLQEKLSVVQGLQQDALSIGDYDQAQNLNGQLITLNNQIQKQYESAAASQRNAYRRGIRDFITGVKTEHTETQEIVNEALRLGGLDGTGEMASQVMQELGTVNSLLEQGVIDEEQAKAISEQGTVGYFNTKYYLALDAVAKLEAQLAATPSDDDTSINNLTNAINSIKEQTYEIPGRGRVDFNKFGQFASEERENPGAFIQSKYSDPDSDGPAVWGISRAPTSGYAYRRLEDGTIEQYAVKSVDDDLLFKNKDSLTKDQKKQTEDREEELKQELNELGYKLRVDGGKMYATLTEESFRASGLGGFVKTGTEQAFDTEGNPIERRTARIQSTIDNEFEIAVNGGGKITFLGRNEEVYTLDRESGQIREDIDLETQQLLNEAAQSFGYITETGIAAKERQVAELQERSLSATGGDRQKLFMEAEMARQRVEADKARLAEQRKKYTVTTRLDENRVPTVTQVANIDNPDTNTAQPTIPKVNTVSTPSLDNLRKLLDKFRSTGSASSSTKTSDTRVRQDGNTTVVSTTARF